MSDLLWVWGLRATGALHWVTLALACMTPIPADWEKNLAALPQVHRRFARAQNFTIGAVIAGLGTLSCFFAHELIAGSPLGRAVCGSTALFWGGRALVLPWLGVRPLLTTPLLRAGYLLLVTECAIYTVLYAWLTVR